jgi:hypothetical protein
MQNQQNNPDPRKFKLPKLLRTAQYELNESKLMDVRNFYHGPVELGDAIARAAKKDFPCATYYLALCYMRGKLTNLVTLIISIEVLCGVLFLL